MTAFAHGGVIPERAQHSHYIFDRVVKRLLADMPFEDEPRRADYRCAQQRLDVLVVMQDRQHQHEIGRVIRKPIEISLCDVGRCDPERVEHEPRLVAGEGRPVNRDGARGTPLETLQREEPGVGPEIHHLAAADVRQVPLEPLPPRLVRHRQQRGHDASGQLDTLVPWPERQDPQMQGHAATDQRHEIRRAVPVGVRREASLAAGRRGGAAAIRVAQVLGGHLERVIRVGEPGHFFGHVVTLRHPRGQLGQQHASCGRAREGTRARGSASDPIPIHGDSIPMQGELRPPVKGFERRCILAIAIGRHVHSPLASGAVEQLAPVPALLSVEPPGEQQVYGPAPGDCRGAGEVWRRRRQEREGARSRLSGPDGRSRQSHWSA